MAKLADTYITQKYLRRWPNSKRARSWAGRMVHVQTESGVWRTGGAGYTWAGKPDAWVLPFEEAQRKVDHCGPEKQAAFIAVPPMTEIKEQIVERFPHSGMTVQQAADFINDATVSDLRARIKVLEEALRPFAISPDDWTVDTVNAARSALNATPQDGKGGEEW